MICSDRPDPTYHLGIRVICLSPTDRTDQSKLRCHVTSAPPFPSGVAHSQASHATCCLVVTSGLPFSGQAPFGQYYCLPRPPASRKYYSSLLFNRPLFPDKMSGRVQKRRAPVPRPTIRRDNLLSIILSSSLEMPSCSACEAAGLSSCQVSLLDSSRCAECVRLGRARCDVLGVSAVQLRQIAEQHSKLDAELAAAERSRRKAEELMRAESDRVQRLRVQKDLWFERMMRAVRRGIDSVEELDRVEREEAEQAAASAAVAPPLPVPDFPPLSPDWGRYPIDPDLLALLPSGKLSRLLTTSSGRSVLLFFFFW
ncbi:hypothetical protein RB594_002277 [Gaeumannomyces avenae]